MKLKLSYKQNDISKEEIEYIINLSQNNFKSVEKEIVGSSAGAADLLTILELTIFSGLQEGILGKDFFKKIVENVTIELGSELNGISNYLISLYKYIKQRDLPPYAVAIAELIDGVMYYAVLNHKRASEKLIQEITPAMIRTVGEISLKRIPINDSHVVQLYPNFESQSWDYLFLPTIKAFGRYIDCYYDFRTNEVRFIKSKEQFYELFEIDEEDIYKIIISPIHYENID